VVCSWPHLTLITMCSSCDVPHARATFLPVAAIIMVGRGHGSLRMLLAPILAALGAISGDVDGNIGWHLLVAAWGHLPTSLCGTKCDCRAACGVQVGSSGVLKNVVVFILASVACVAQRSHTRACLVSLSMSPGFDVLILLP
jgi:hypothetical protein